jgi:hypothetical protein
LVVLNLLANHAFSFTPAFLFRVYEGTIQGIRRN